MNDLRFEDLLIKKQHIKFINTRGKLDHIGKNIYVYDLTPITFLRFSRSYLNNNYKIFGLEEYDKTTKDLIESIIMERTLNIVLSKKSLDYYLNNINAYIELINDYVYEDICVNLSISYDNKEVYKTIKKYIKTFSRIINYILADSIDINYNIKDMKDTESINWEKAFYVLDYTINIKNTNFRLEIARYYYYKDEDLHSELFPSK